ncbi:MAG: aspartate carbamoyltransferase regulatory subunit [Clostridia bacterium]|nr:aspartate carbamoyltransferase regulatory subunit [Clostridia bacterium]
MTIDSIKNGVVIDHIKSGKAMEIYRLLNLENTDWQVAIIKNAPSKKLGKKDIIKIASDVSLDLDVLGFIDPDITVNVIKDGSLFEKKHIELPKRITDVIKCKNPRCITTTEQGISHVFELKDFQNRVYRCAYYEAKAE